MGETSLYIFPGDIGLGPLQALCHNLIPVVIEAMTHNPERGYLNDKNSFILDKGITASQYADAIESILSDQSELSMKRESAWQSIEHLTIEKMAENFIKGVNYILA